MNIKRTSLSQTNWFCSKEDKLEVNGQLHVPAALPQDKLQQVTFM
jgi:hypothetical protein